MQDTWFFGSPFWQRKNWIAAMLLILLSIESAQNGVAAKQAKLLDVSEFDLKSNTLGLGTLYVRQDGIKWAIPSHGLIYEAYAPGWQMMLYNTRTHLGKKKEYQTWKDFVSPREAMNVTSMFSKHALFMGLPARSVTLGVAPADSFSSKTELMYQDGQERAGAYTSIELLESAWVDLKPQQVEFVRYITGIPKVQGIVLKQQNVYPGGRRETVINALALRNGKIKSEDWIYPAKFTDASMSQVRGEKQCGVEAAEMLGTFILDNAPETTITKTTKTNAKKVPIVQRRVQSKEAHH